MARLQPSAISAAVPIETASAPIANALATSAPLRMPPDMINCTFRCWPSSWSASTAWRKAGKVGMPACSINTSWVAPVPPCIKHDDVGPGLDRELDIVARPRRADLDKDRLLPIGGLAQLLDLYGDRLDRSNRDGGRHCADRCQRARCAFGQPAR